MSDPYPGYYQKPSGEWTAYDPEYYKSFWETWNRKAVKDAQDKGKRKERGWEGAEDDDLQTVDAQEEMQKSQLADREVTKNITAVSNAAEPAQPKMNIKVCAFGFKDALASLNLICCAQPRLEVMHVEGVSFRLCWLKHIRIVK